MDAYCLQFFIQENRQVHGRLLYEWLLEQARDMGVRGGSAVRAMAGYGRHGRLHEDHFFELGGELPVIVDFVVKEEEADSLLALVSAEKLGLFYVLTPARFGTTD